MLIRQETADDLPRPSTTSTGLRSSRRRPATSPSRSASSARSRADEGWLPASRSSPSTRAKSSVTWCAAAGRSAAGRSVGLGPIGVLPDRQGDGFGGALMHAVLGAADALGHPVVVLLGHLDYYPRFGFVPAGSIGIPRPIRPGSRTSRLARSVLGAPR